MMQPSKAQIERELKERDRLADKLVEMATEIYVVFRFMMPRERSRRRTEGFEPESGFELLCWVERKSEAERIVRELRNGNRNAPTLVPRGAWDRGHAYGYRAVSVSNATAGGGLQGALELCERLMDDWARRADLMQDAARSTS